jgi:hypothetical protein
LEEPEDLEFLERMEGAEGIVAALLSSPASWNSCLVC